MKNQNNMMKQIFFPGFNGQACEAWYGIAIESKESISRANIVVVQSNSMEMGTSLWNTDDGRDSVLNRILNQDLKGVRIEFITLTIVLDLNNSLQGMEFPISFNVDDYVEKGNPYNLSQLPAENIRGKLLNLIGMGNKQISCWSGHVVGGCTDFFTKLNEGKRVERARLNEFFKKIGYEPVTQSSY